MNSDPQGFHYPFQAMLERQRWQLESIQRALVCALRVHAAAVDELSCQRTVHQALLDSSDITANRCDPVQAHARLQYLCNMAGRIQQQVRACEDHDRQCNASRQHCRDAQARLDALQQHRDDARMAHLQTQGRLESRLADHDWLARWKAVRPPGEATQITGGAV